MSKNNEEKGEGDESRYEDEGDRSEYERDFNQDPRANLDNIEYSIEDFLEIEEQLSRFANPGYVDEEYGSGYERNLALEQELGLDDPDNDEIFMARSKILDRRTNSLKEFVEAPATFCAFRFNVYAEDNYSEKDWQLLRHVMSNLLLNNKTLTSLTLSNIKSSDTRIIALIAKDLLRDQTLIVLNLCNNQIGDEIAITIAYGLRYNESLKSLYLGDDEEDIAPNENRNEIGDIGAIELALALQYNDTLSTLDLKQNKISDNVLWSIKEILDCRSENLRLKEKEQAQLSRLENEEEKKEDYEESEEDIRLQEAQRELQQKKESLAQLKQEVNLAQIEVENAKLAKTLKMQREVNLELECQWELQSDPDQFVLKKYLTNIQDEINLEERLGGNLSERIQTKFKAVKAYESAKQNFDFHNNNSHVGKLFSALQEIQLAVKLNPNNPEYKELRDIIHNQYKQIKQNATVERFFDEGDDIDYSSNDSVSSLSSSLLGSLSSSSDILSSSSSYSSSSARSVSFEVDLVGEGEDID